MPRKVIRPRTRKSKENTREYRLMKILTEKVFENKEPFVYAGYYSWLRSELNQPMQIDLLFLGLAATGRPLAVEVQSDLHRGKWEEVKDKLKRFFKTSEEFERQLRNDKRKKEILEKMGIPLLEIWPEESLSDIEAFKEKISKIVGVKIA